MADEAGQDASGQDAHRRETALLRDHVLFDADWYLTHNPDVSATGMDAVDHFVEHGWREGRDPGPAFSVQWYLAAYTDVAASGLNPLVHYVDHGCEEGRLSHPDALARAQAPVNGQDAHADHRDATAMTARDAAEVSLVAGHPLFDADWYAANTPTLAASGLPPATHFVLCGGFEGRSPGPDFDLLAYLDRRGDVEQAGINALVHFINHCEQEGRAIDAA